MGCTSSRRPFNEPNLFLGPVVHSAPVRKINLVDPIVAPCETINDSEPQRTQPAGYVSAPSGTALGQGSSIRRDGSGSLSTNTRPASAHIPKLIGTFTGQSITQPSSPQDDDPDLVALREQCPRFRILGIGRAGAGETTILQRICNADNPPIVHHRNGNEVDISTLKPTESRGTHDINSELYFSRNNVFVFPGFPGFSACSADEVEAIRDVIAQRRAAARALYGRCIPTEYARRIRKYNRPQREEELSCKEAKERAPDGSKLSLNPEDSHLVVFRNDRSRITGGGFGDIYQGIHLPSRQILALKRPRVSDEHGSSGDVTRRFLREAETWSTFDHVNILPFYGLITLRKEMHITSPWMERGDLSGFLRRHLVEEGDPPSKEDAFDASFNEAVTIREIASGIAYLHSNNYVHGDIKAKNILLAEDGRALLCDFGLTKFSDSATTGLKGAGSVKWMAPEVLQYESKSSASDVYAFAMTIVEILTCEVPFPKLGGLQAMWAVLHHGERPPTLPLSRRGRCFAPLWEIATQCWATKPDDRLLMREVLSKLEVGSAR